MSESITEEGSTVSSINCDFANALIGTLAASRFQPRWRESRSR